MSFGCNQREYRTYTPLVFNRVSLCVADAFLQSFWFHEQHLYDPGTALPYNSVPDLVADQPDYFNAADCMHIKLNVGRLWGTGEHQGVY